MSLVALISPDSDVAVMTTVALLEANGIPCFVRGGGFGGLYPGPRIQGYNGTTVMVPEELLLEAQGLLAAVPLEEDFVPPSDGAPALPEKR
jgi:Putative prokaryotic signal transducing protein